MASGCQKRMRLVTLSHVLEIQPPETTFTVHLRDSHYLPAPAAVHPQRLQHGLSPAPGCVLLPTMLWGCLGTKRPSAAEAGETLLLGKADLPNLPD